MKYVVLVSHGTFAQGLHSVLKMLAGGDRADVLSTGMEDGMLERTRAYGGMNLPMALTAVLMKDTVDGDTLETSMLTESKNAMARMRLHTEEDGEDDI